MSGDPIPITMPLVPHEMLVQNMVEKGGFPERIARRFMGSPELVLEATVFLSDCMEMEAGDGQARERVDNVREKVQAMRDAETALGNNPELGSIAPIRGFMGMPQPIPRRAIAARKEDLAKIRPSIVLPPGYDRRNG